MMKMQRQDKWPKRDQINGRETEPENEQGNWTLERTDWSLLTNH